MYHCGKWTSGSIFHGGPFTIWHRVPCSCTCLSRAYPFAPGRFPYCKSLLPVGQLLCGTVVRLVSILVSLSDFPQQRPRVSASASPIDRPRPNDYHFRLRWLIYSGSTKLNNDAHSLTPSHAPTVMAHINGSVTTPESRVLTVSSSRSCCLPRRLKVVASPLPNSPYMFSLVVQAAAFDSIQSNLAC